MHKSIYYLLILCAALAEAMGDGVLKKWAVSQNSHWFILGILLYLTSVITWAFSLKYELISKAIIVVMILNTLFVLIIGSLFFKESLTDIQKLGVVFALIGLVLIEL